MAVQQIFRLNKLLTTLFFILSAVAHASEYCPKADGLKINIAIGYIDQIPGDQVIDGLYYSRLKNSLLKECVSEEENLCGFTQVSGEVFQKNETTVRLISSSVSSSNQYNIQSGNQKVKSAYAQKTFVEMIQDGDVVFYFGHSRKRGGPDFSPPLLTKDGRVNYNYYQHKKAGVYIMKQELLISNSELLGLYSCDSEENFKEIAEIISTIFTNNSLSPSEAYLKMTIDLKNLLSKRCLSTKN